jgi:hypothetical protein
MGYAVASQRNQGVDMQTDSRADSYGQSVVELAHRGAPVRYAGLVWHEADLTVRFAAPGFPRDGRVAGCRYVDQVVLRFPNFQISGTTSESV